MLPPTFRVVLDANILVQSPIRDTLLRAAEKGMCQIYWSEQILEETHRVLRLKLNISRGKAESLSSALKESFPEALVEDFDHLIPAMRNQEKDRHVAAVAIKIGAQVIVTDNLSDFKNLEEGVEAQSADDFLSSLADLDIETMTTILKEQMDALKDPPVSFQEGLNSLERKTPEFIAMIRAHLTD